MSSGAVKGQYLLVKGGLVAVGGVLQSSEPNARPSYISFTQASRVALPVIAVFTLSVAALRFSLSPLYFDFDFGAAESCFGVAEPGAGEADPFVVALAFGVGAGEPVAALFPPVFFTSLFHLLTSCVARPASCLSWF